MINRDFFEHLQGIDTVVEMYAGSLEIHSGVTEVENVKEWRCIVSGIGIAENWQWAILRTMGFEVDHTESVSRGIFTTAHIAMDYRQFLWLRKFMRFGDLMQIGTKSVSGAVGFPSNGKAAKITAERIFEAPGKNGQA